jgi:alpha-tubulin suppressor-like RCC1 family protein
MTKNRHLKGDFMKKYILSSMLLGTSLFFTMQLKADDAETLVVSFLETMISQCDEVLVETQESYAETMAIVGSLQDDLITCESILDITEQSLQSYQEILAEIEDFGPVTKIAAGDSHTIILLENGSVWAAGYNNYGQLGTGDTFQRTAFTQMATDPAATFIDIAAAGNYSLALKNDGTVWATGYNNYGQLGIGTSGTGESRATLTQMTDNNSDITAIAAGQSHSLVLKNDGTVWATGYNNYGQLGIGTSGTGENRATLTQMTSSNSSVTAITAGLYHSLVLKNDGTVWGTGYNWYGQLGIGTSGTGENRVTLTQMTDFNSSVTAIAAGQSHSLVLKNDGTVWATGSNLYGQLGIGTSGDNKTILTHMTDFNSSVTAIKAGAYHSLVLKNDGTAWTTGYNNRGQLGIGTSGAGANKTILTPMTDFNSSVTAIAAGAYHSVALKDNGSVWTTGYNYYSQLSRGLDSTNLPQATTLGLTARAVQP